MSVVTSTRQDRTAMRQLRRCDLDLVSLGHWRVVDSRTGRVVSVITEDHVRRDRRVIEPAHMVHVERWRLGALLEIRTTREKR